MALNLISNHAANIAHRTVSKSDMQMSNSLAKLSSGTRVISAKDDAASLAIGSRIAAEVGALRQARVNTDQATSMLQIADGAMSTVQDVLTRMKTLSVQGASDNLTATERGMLDTEYQALLQEIDRVANDTDFNGSKLVRGSTAVDGAASSIAAAADNFVQATDGVVDVAFDNSVTESAYTLEYDSSSNVLTLTNLTDGTSQGVDIGSTAIAANGTQEVRFGAVGATITLNSAFNKSAAISAEGGSLSATGGGGGAILASSIKITGATGSGAQALTTNVVAIDGTTANASTLTIGGYSATADLSSTGVKTATLTDGTDSFTVEFQVTTALSNTDEFGMDVNGLGAMVFADAQTSSTTSFTFKVGTGTESAEDDVTFSIDAITQTALGINGTSLTGATVTNSETALDAVNAAIDTLNTSRATIGAAQNRLGFASANLATTIENQEASRSTLLDLDVASEMSSFTSKQVLMQAGISMMAQANQIPQNLMQLFQ